MSSSTSPTRLRRLAGAGLVALAAMGTACGDDTPQAVRDREQAISAAEEFAAGPDAAAEAKRIGATPIDVRTAAEYAEGHVSEATNLDVESGAFAAGIAQLDPATTYVVYCRSGRRSAIAADQMRDAGITVFDGGALEDMAGAGWPTS